MTTIVGAIAAAAIYTATASSTNDLASVTYFTFPAISAFVWIPLGLGSLVVAIFALARREPQPVWAIALLAVNAVALPIDGYLVSLLVG